MMEINTQRIYQTTALSPDLVDRMVVDDSPAILFDEFWAFLGIDIPVANIKEHDFRIIRLMAQRQILYILARYPENEWDKIAIFEYEMRQKTDANGNLLYRTQQKTDANGKELFDVSDPKNPVPIMESFPFLENRIKRQYLINEIINSLDSKIYVKLCRAREGFTLNSLTEERLQQDIRDSRPSLQQAPGVSAQAQKSGGWRF